MYRILLVCAAGMSTSLLVTRMRKAAEENNIDAKIDAMPLMKVDASVKDNWDIIMLGPQVKNEKIGLEKKTQHGLPIAVIGMRDYGMMDGKAVVEQAVHQLG